MSFNRKNDWNVIPELTKGKSANIAFFRIIRIDTTSTVLVGSSYHDCTGLKATVGTYTRSRSLSISILGYVTSRPLPQSLSTTDQFEVEDCCDAL